MKRSLCVVFLGLALIGVSSAQDAKKDESPAPKAKLPTYWSKLGLSDAQKQEYYQLHHKHQRVIDELMKKLADEKSALKADEDKLLTTEQKSQLKALLLKEPTPKPVKDK